MCAFLQSGDKVLHIFVTFQHFSNLFNRMDDGTVVASAKGPAQFGIREAQMATADVHGGLPGHDQPRVASRARDVGGGGIAAACGLGQDLFVAGMAGLHRSRTGQTFQIVQAGMPGGIIFPGVKLSLDAMTTRCAQLPGISLDKPKQVIGKNTVDCMRSGMMYGTAAMIDGLVERIEEELGHECTLVATGGMAQFIIPLCKRDIILDKNMLLKGLNILYQKNKR